MTLVTRVAEVDITSFSLLPASRREKESEEIMAKASVASRLVGNPISWGVCEVPDWGYQLAPRTVLGEMKRLGLSGTEQGPVGYLGTTPVEVANAAAEFGLPIVGAFVPLVMHDRSQRESMRKAAHFSASLLGATGKGFFITAVVVDEGWGPRFPLSDAQWQAMFDGFSEVDEICAGYGIRQVLHPHLNTLVETYDDVQRVVAGSSVRWLLDTGHLQIGGTDPAKFAKDHFDRVDHVHIKDAKMSIAKRFLAREISLLEATRDGVFCSAGDGDVPVAEVVRTMESRGYEGWYVLEQDIAIVGDQARTPDAASTAVERSIRYLSKL
jgi:inosose dehydratase